MSSNPPPPIAVRVDVLPAPTSEKRKSAWIEILNSTVVAAVVTAMVGGVAAQCVVQRYQKAQKDAEAALLRQKERNASQRTTSDFANDVLTEGYAHAHRLHALTLPSFNIEKALPLEKPLLEAQHRQVIAAWNSFEGQWRQKKQKVALMLSYDFDGDETIATKWRDSAGALDALLAAATAERARERVNPGLFEPNPNALAEEDVALEIALADFAKAIDGVRQRNRVGAN